MVNFHSFSTTRKGAKHEDDVPCQDASTHFDLGTARIAAVADGHGSSRCFRSDIGAGKAIEIVKTCMANFVTGTAETQDDRIAQLIVAQDDVLSKTQTALCNVVRTIINKWFVAVMKDDEANPLQNDPRLNEIEPKYKDRYINDVDYRCHAYGTTLMVVAMSNDYWFGFQVGDGKCVVLYEDGTWKMPIPWDDRCSFNTTTSICDDDSLSGFRYWIGFKNGKGGYKEYGGGVKGQNRDYDIETACRPLAIFIGSDGVEDSYPRVDNDKYVVNFYRNRIVSMAESGLATFNAEMDGFAKRFADRESTDDVSIAGIVSDFTGMTKMISKMKNDSARHEASEQAAEKRRDADEKKQALDTLENRYQTAVSNIRHLEVRIRTTEEEISSLNSRKKQMEAFLSRSNTDLGICDRLILTCQGLVKRLVDEKTRGLNDKKTLEEKIEKADEEILIAENALKKISKDCRAASSSLDKISGAYNKCVQELFELDSRQTVTKQAFDDIIIQLEAMFESYMSDDYQHPTQTIQNRSVTASTSFEFVHDPRLEKLKREVDKENAAFQDMKTRVEAARQNRDIKLGERDRLRQLLSDAQQRVDQVDSDLAGANQDYHTAEEQTHQKQVKVKKCQREISEIDKRIKHKQADIEKFNNELNALTEQTKKQTGTLNTIREAWEKAEAEAKSLEMSILKT